MCVCVCVSVGRDALGSLKAVKKKVFVDERWSKSRNVTAMDWSCYVSVCVISPDPMCYLLPPAP